MAALTTTGATLVAPAAAARTLTVTGAALSAPAAPRTLTASSMTLAAGAAPDRTLTLTGASLSSTGTPSATLTGMTLTAGTAPAAAKFTITDAILAAAAAPPAPNPDAAAPLTVKVAGQAKPATLWVRHAGQAKPATRRRHAAYTTLTGLAADDGATFPNPGRGLTIPQESHWRSPYPDNFWALSNPTEPWATRVTRGDTLCFRMYYLDDLNTPGATVPQALRDYITADMATARQQGIKIIARFAYKMGSDPVGAGPYQDNPGVATILTHMDALLPLLDPSVVHVLQAGWYGLWGERYYTDLTSWEDRAALLDRALAKTPTGIPIALRYNGEYEHYLTSRPNATKADLDRFTLHNDAFTAVEAEGGDYGTYTIATRNSISGNKQWVTARAARLPVGGEIGTYMTSPWAGAQTELAARRASYMNGAQIPSVWDTPTLRRNLGYRLTVTRVEHTTPQPGATMTVRVTIANTGWAAPTPARPILVEAVNGATTVQATATLDSTALQPGTAAITAALAIPSGAPAGSWSLRLWMPDPATALRDNPAYAVRVANPGAWTPATGRNAIGSTAPPT